MWRQSLDRTQSIFALHNVSAETVDVPKAAMNIIEDESWLDLLSGEHIPVDGDTVTLSPYQCRWITNLH